VHWYGSGRQAGSVVAPGGRVALSRLALGRRGAEALSLSLGWAIPKMVI